MDQATTKSSRQPGGKRPVPNLELLKARMQLGLSREEVGDMAGISGKQVGLIERGKARHSRFDTLANLAKAVDRDVLDLFPVSSRFKR